MASAPTLPQPPAADDIDAMSAERRRVAFEQGELDRDQLVAWAARYPKEIPLVNDELPWIAGTLADLD
ncbi:MAG TPA: hypothetical protein VJ204_18760 [Solirubrobacterales bacterium]|nr:hypothetical protein [Solirubrobacterales bacterium]